MTTYILAINAGSSSLKASLFDFKTLEQVHTFHFKNCKEPAEQIPKIKNQLEKLNFQNIRAIAHRVVHGGESYTEATLITPQVEKEIKQLGALAPLHNPINLDCIKAAKKLFKCPHFAVFDTAFFSDIPAKAYLYGIPNKYYFDDKIRKYGFHGINHQYVYNQSCQQLGFKKASGIICHLGSGCSVSAIKNGRAVDISMGFTPLDGLIMATRSGSIDPGIIFYLQKKYPRLDVQKLLQEKSGLFGLSQLSNHMRDIFLAAKKGHKQSQVTIDTFCYKIASFVGFYANLLPDLDFITFTGGIGENASYVRNKVLRNLPGLVLDLEQVLVVPANEAYQMAIESKKVLAKID